MALSREMRRLLEIAGTLEHHEKEEHRLFHAVIKQLKMLEEFCDKQHEEDVYGPFAEEARELAKKLEHHFDRYEHMSKEKEHEIEHPETKADREMDQDINRDDRE
jgi:hypothetical protein